jgi:hypothetical protein
MTAYPELIRYAYVNRIPSDNGILGNWVFAGCYQKPHSEKRTYQAVAQVLSFGFGLQRL